MFKFSIPFIGSFLFDCASFAVPYVVVSFRHLRVFLSVGDAGDGLGPFYLNAQLYRGYCAERHFDRYDDILCLGKSV